MAKGKAKKIEAFYDKYSTTVVYEYRGHRYEVTYSNCWTYCTTPAWVQHRDAQAEIDDMIDNPKPLPEKEAGQTVQEALDEWFEYLNQA